MATGRQSAAQMLQGRMDKMKAEIQRTEGLFWLAKDMKTGSPEEMALWDLLCNQKN